MSGQYKQFLQHGLPVGSGAMALLYYLRQRRGSLVLVLLN